MNKQQQIESFDRIVSKMREVLLAKGDDYAADADRLSNFKQVGTICGIGAARACLVLIATKVARLGNLLGDGLTGGDGSRDGSGVERRAVRNESIADSVLDLTNYGVLLGQILEDEEGGDVCK